MECGVEDDNDSYLALQNIYDIPQVVRNNTTLSGLGCAVQGLVLFGKITVNSVAVSTLAQGHQSIAKLTL
jgi:hypothetical protein